MLEYRSFSDVTFEIMIMSSYHLEILVEADSTRCHTENTSAGFFFTGKRKNFLS